MFLNEQVAQECVKEGILVITKTLGKNLGEISIVSVPYIMTLLDKILHFRIDEFTYNLLVKESEMEDELKKLNEFRESMKRKGVFFDLSIELVEDEVEIIGMKTLDVKIAFKKSYEYKHLVDGGFLPILPPTQLIKWCREKEEISPEDRDLIDLMCNDLDPFYREVFYFPVNDYLRNGRFNLEMKKAPAGMEGEFLFLDKLLTYEKWLGRDVLSVVKSIAIHELLHKEEKMEKFLNSHFPCLPSTSHYNEKNEVITELSTILVLHLNKMNEEINILKRCRKLEYLHALEPRKSSIEYYLKAHDFYEKNWHLL
ncbi:MAG: hypothetical protein QW472_02555 [Candidatus Aenigmatarchaeota archaeon]